MKPESGYDLTPLSDAQREKIAAGLTPEERYVLLDHGTERPFCGTLLNNKASGLYAGKARSRRRNKGLGTSDSGLARTRSALRSEAALSTSD